MAGEDDQNINNQPPNPPPPTQQAPHTVSPIIPSLKKGEYDIWAMKMEHYLAHTDYPVWEKFWQKKERKARTTLLMALPEDHLTRFHNISDAKEMWNAIKTRFDGNAKNTGYKGRYQRTGKQEQPKALLTIDAGVIDWSGQAEEEEEDHALMAFNSNSSSNEVQSCSDEYVASYNKLKKLYDEQREQLGDASIEIQAYTQALKKVEAQLVAHQQSQLWYEEKIRFMKIDLDDKTDVLTYHKKLLAEAEKEKEDLKAKVEKWHNSSKNLNILLNSQMSARDKAGLGYGNQMNKGVLSYENEVFQSVFVSRTSETENSPVNDRYAEGMHAVPPPITGIYIPSGPDTEIDDSQFTYGPKQSKPSESDARSSDFTSCESNTSEETHESMPETVVNEPTVVSQPKVWNDAPIIEEYESDSEDEHVSLPSKEQETPISTARASGTNNVSTARHNFNSQAVLTNAAKKISTVKPFVNKGELIKGKAKVLWDYICKPKDQGGLGLKDLHKWNETLLLKLLWNVAAKKDTLWVKWINVEKQKGRNLWDMQIDSNSSPMWKTFLGMRDKIRDHIRVEIGNGKSTSVWYDKWHSMGPLCIVVTKRDVYAARMTDKVPNLKELKSDVTKWKDNNGRLVDFSIKQAWKDRNAEGMRVNWKDMVCDSHDHLFFNCRYSEIIWKKMQTKLCRKFSMNWQTVIVEMSQNSRLFGGIKRNEEALSLEIEDTIRLSLVNVKVKESSAVRKVEDKTAKTQEED
ncbi:hypothetical protein Tco_0497085 [Tanacetum coccineum]